VDTSLIDQYQRQEQWRRWSEALAVLPVRNGQQVLDLGCGIGQVTALLNQMGAEVVGVDANEELLTAARARCPHIRFEKSDLHDVTPDRFGQVDGLWASFVTAYFPDLESVLARWSKCLRLGGWLAMVEMDDLFGHEPFPPQFRQDLAGFYDEAKRAGRYDFKGGRRLATTARAVGLEILHESVLADDELSFVGAARPDVLEAWRERLQRMGGLKAFMGDRFNDFEEAFVATLTSEKHRSTTRVVFVVARRLTHSPY
jgi:SAM-dependent methyltransferase